MIRRKPILTKKPMGTASSETVMERCILCGRPTEVPVTQPVSSRKHYVTGLGQLCPDCGRMMALGAEETDA